ncbi:MAG: hypothetical protein IJS50_01000 [Desulfovibrio sp.]|nr:hypothetical protein [Desulfovibrio sp.]
MSLEKNMTDSWGSGRVAFWLSCAFLWTVIFTLSYLTPFMTDNYLFSQNMTPNYAAFMSGAPIEKLEPMTLKAAFEQSVTMYSTWCGRFMGNFLVYTAFLLPKLLRLSLSAALFVALCVLIIINISGRNYQKHLTAAKLLLVAAMLWLGMPSFGSAFFWVSVGGLPAMVAQLLFLLPFRLALDDPEASWLSRAKVFWLGLFFLFGVATCSLDYATSAAMPVAALTGLGLYAYKKGRLTFSPLLTAGFLGVSLGAALTLLARGNSERLRLTTDAEAHAWVASSFLEKLVAYLGHLPEAIFMQALPLFFLGWAFWVLYRNFGKAYLCRLPLAMLLYVMPFAATLGAYFFTPWPPARAFCTTYVQLTVFSLLAVEVASSVLASSKLKSSKFRQSYQVLLVLLGLFSLHLLYVEIGKFYEVHQLSLEREKIFLAHRGQDVRIPPLPVRGDRHMVLGSHLNDVSYEPDFWFNRALAAYYGLKSVALQKDTKSTLLFLTCSDTSGQNLKLDCKVLGRKLAAKLLLLSPTKPSYQEIALYYHGEPGLLKYLPNFLQKIILNKLAESNSFLHKLVPLFFARADLDLKYQEGDGAIIGQGEATLWGGYPGDFPYFLVQPGKSKFSLTLFKFSRQEN